MRIVAGLFAFAFIAGCAQSRTESGLSQAEALDSMPPSAPKGVQLEGPAEVTVSTYAVSHKSGKAIKVEIDKKTIKACFSGIGYSVTKLQSDNEYFVEIEPLAVPAVMCSPAMMRDIQVGTSIDIPKSAAGGTFATIHVHNKLASLSQPKVKVSSGAKLGEAVLSKLDSYSYYSNTGDGFSIEIDKRKISVCSAGNAYETSTLFSGGFFVKAMPLAIRRFCPPGTTEQIETGTEIRIPRADGGFQYGTLLVTRPSGEALKVSVREDRKPSKALQCNVYDDAGDVVREMRIGLFYSEGAEKATATIESRFAESSEWNLDFSETQTTVVAEGKGITRLLAEARTSFPGYVDALDWRKDPRLSGRCWAALPNYDLDLSNAVGTPAYVGEVTINSSILTDPTVRCDMPQFSMAPPAKPTLIKCGAENDQVD